MSYSCGLVYATVGRRVDCKFVSGSHVVGARVTTRRGRTNATGKPLRSALKRINAGNILIAYGSYIFRSSVGRGSGPFSRPLCKATKGCD